MVPWWPSSYNHTASAALIPTPAALQERPSSRRVGRDVVLPAMRLPEDLGKDGDLARERQMLRNLREMSHFLSSLGAYAEHPDALEMVYQVTGGGNDAHMLILTSPNTSAAAADGRHQGLSVVLLQARTGSLLPRPLRRRLPTPSLAPWLSTWQRIRTSPCSRGFKKRRRSHLRRSWGRSWRTPSPSQAWRSPRTEPSAPLSPSMRT